MLHFLNTQNTGPLSKMELDFGKRFNIITGDNGLGKSFLLDVIWWSLTRTWPQEINPALMSGFMARPSRAGEPATIHYCFDGEVKDEVEHTSQFRGPDQRWAAEEEYPQGLPPAESKWPLKQGRPAIPGLVIYAQADGSFAVWDPARNYKRKDFEDKERPPAFVFSKTEIFEGLNYKEKKICNGLIYDVSFWQSARDTTNWDIYSSSIQKISPSWDEILIPGELISIDPLTSNMIPTIKMPYCQDIPIVHASSGIKRIVSLIYLLTWAWTEHKRASQVLSKAPTDSIIILMDEVECHLHPKWQRTILPSLRETILGLSGLSSHTNIQIFATTHAPLVMASLETIFDEAKDLWFDFDAKDDRVELDEKNFIRFGTASNWLTSDAFDLKSATSLEYEKIMEKIKSFLIRNDQTEEEMKRLKKELDSVSYDLDPYWLDLRDLCREKGWEL